MPATPKPKVARKVAPRTRETDPTSDERLLALAVSYAGAPDMPVAVAVEELASLARAGKARGKVLNKVGLTPAKVETLARFAVRLKQLESAWQRARKAVKLTAIERQQLIEAEALDAKLVAGGRWACRSEEDAQVELSRIADGSGLSDTVQDLRDLVDFWAQHPEEIGVTDITDGDLTRADELVEALESAADKEADNVGAAAAMELRNRCFWAGDELAKEVREGGRYSFRLQPKVAATFVSRYRTSAVRRAKRKAKDKNVGTATKPG